ncbi:MAG TPA: MEDS domain-containing protein [Nitrospira sp.]|nr:MEDS domain-containing protein [Nitrospira sp.]
MSTATRRRLGIPGFPTAPWGEHVCVFFKNKEQLLSLVVPFIQAGLEDNEFCMWITADPITEKEAFQALEKAVPHAHEYLAGKQLEILPYKQWYLPSGYFDAQICLDMWVGKARYTEKKGLDGIRITGNPVWLRSEEDWTKFGHYERSVHNRIQNERVIALCTYPIDRCTCDNLLSTLTAHSSALMLESDQWRRIDLNLQ